MTYGLKDFYSTATRYGFARDNLLRLESISGVAGDGKPLFPDSIKDLQLYLKMATLPSRNITSGKVNYRSFTFNVPMEATYQENLGYAVTFYCDKWYIIKDILERWSNATYNEHQFISSTNFNACNMSLLLLDNSNSNEVLSEMKQLKRYTLNGCFLTQIGQMAYDVSSKGVISTCAANLAFQYVTSENI